MSIDFANLRPEEIIALALFLAGTVAFFVWVVWLWLKK
jgi:hypothetical protein